MPSAKLILVEDDPALAELLEFRFANEGYQVRVTAEAFANMDERGELAAAFAPPKGASDELIRQVETEEGWILGVTRLPPV